MVRRLASVAFALGLGLASTYAVAQEQKSAKAGPGEKVCRYKFPNGERRAWVCKKEEPCCAWDAIQYTKCGSVTFNCL